MVSQTYCSICEEILRIEYKIVLIIDNAPPHTILENFKSKDGKVTTMFLPANTYYSLWIKAFLKLKTKQNVIKHPLQLLIIENKGCCLLVCSGLGRGNRNFSYQGWNNLLSGPIEK